jgi:hypothetical protein
MVLIKKEFKDKHELTSLMIIQIQIVPVIDSKKKTIW